jgi:hypothetical protein
MTEPVLCPKCQSAETFYSGERKEYHCGGCSHRWKFAASLEHHSLRIFLSYGHDPNEELVLLIKADLEKRGHDVWFDKSEIKTGDDWRRAITDGVLSSHRVLSFLSKHSTRDPGVCLDEIGIALGVKGGNIQTILVEGEAEAKPPSTISHIQWLDMHDWKKQRKAGGRAWAQWYQAKLDEIVRVVESEQSRQFAGEIAQLQEYLNPISSETRISFLFKKGFVGREWLFEAVEKWRTRENRDSRLFWITGAPGVGKSAFAAQLAHFGRDKIIAAQFVEWNQSPHRDPARVVKNLAFQLAARLPDYRKLLLTLPEIGALGEKKPTELFRYLLVDPLSQAIQGGRERYLIVIDALDEAKEGERNPLVELLAREAKLLPDWLGIIVTSRPEESVTGPLQGLKPCFLDTATETNRDDIRRYLNHTLSAQLSGRQDAGSLVDKILEKSEGVFLYIEHVCREIQEGHLSLDRPGDFPIGLGGIYQQFFSRQFPDFERYCAEIRPALRIILAALQPLPLEILQRLFHWQDEQLRDFTGLLGSLFPVASDQGVEIIRPFHKSLVDWLNDKTKAGKYYVSMAEGHRLLSEWGFAEYHHDPNRLPGYFLRHLPSHLLAAARTADAAEVMTEFGYHYARLERLGVAEVLQVTKDFIAVARAEVPRKQRDVLETWQRFHDDIAHILRRPSIVPQVELLQRADAHADTSPVTQSAEAWLKQNGTKHWWLRKLWRPRDVVRSACLRTLEGHTLRVTSVALHADGRRAVWARHPGATAAQLLGSRHRGQGGRGSPHRVPGDEGLFAREPHVHSRLRGGMARGRLCPTACWTIALGPQPGAAHQAQGPRRMPGLRRCGDGARLVARGPGVPKRDAHRGPARQPVRIWQPGGMAGAPVAPPFHGYASAGGSGMSWQPKRTVTVTAVLNLSFLHASPLRRTARLLMAKLQPLTSFFATKPLSR